MFAVNVKTKVVVRALLISVILLNSFGASATGLVKPRQGEVSSIALNLQDTEPENRTVSTDARLSNDTGSAVENQPTAQSDIGASATFVENVGQFDSRARFQAQANGASMYFSEDAIWFTLMEPPSKDPNEDHHSAIFDGLVEENQEPRKGVNLKVNLIGSNPHPILESFNKAPTSFSYFAGSDPSNWYPDVPVWGGIRYVDIYPGMDLEITSEQNRLLWQFLVTDVSRFYEKNNQVAQQGIRIKIAGHQRFQTRNNTLDIATDVGTLPLPVIRVNDVEFLPEVNKNGELIIPVPAQTSITLGTFKTVSYKIPTGTELNLSSTWQPASSTQTASTYQQSSEDALIYSAYFGTKYTLGDAIAVDSDGAVYVTGSVGWDDFPTGAGVFYLPGASSTSYDSFVAKIDLDANQLIYTAFFKTKPVPGCDNTGGVGGIAVDNDKNVYVVGTTGNPDFPTTEGVIDRQLTDECPGNPHYGYEERADGFILKLNAAGIQLLYSTYLGGSEFDSVAGIFVGEDGSAFVAGNTYSTDIPKGTQGYSHTLSGQNDIFITKLSPAADQQEFFTYVGGSNTEWTFGNLKVGNDDSMYLAGRTASTDFPTTEDAYIPSYSNSGLCPSYAGCYNAFALKLDSTGGELMYATYLGEVGTGYATDLDIDEAGHAYISGWVRGGADFPHTRLLGPGSPSPTGMDGLVVKLATDGKSAFYSTLVGGKGSDTLWAISVDDAGNAYLVGDSSSPDFPIPPGALDTSIEEFGADLIVGRLDPSGSQLTYATFLGGSGWEYMTWHGAPLDSNGNLNILVRNTESTDFPTNHSPIGNGTDGSNEFGWWTSAVVRLSTNNMPVIPYDCSWNLSPIGKAVFNEVVPDKQEAGEVCGNLYSSDSLITLPPGQPAFVRFAELATNAQHEIDFTTMEWDPAKDNDPDTTDDDSPGEVFLRGVKELYEKVKDPVGSGLPADYYAGGVRVRILIGRISEQKRQRVINDLHRLGIDRVNPGLGWTVEVAAFRNEFGMTHSHVKMMIVDGKQVIVAGYNMQYMYLEGTIWHDMGVEISGPVAQRALKVFDGLWLGAKRCHVNANDLNCEPVSTIEIPIAHHEDILNPIITGNDAVFSLFRDSTDKTADNAIFAAINAANSEVNILQNRFYAPLTINSFPGSYLEAVLNALEKGDGQVQVNLLVSGGLENGAINTAGICDLWYELLVYDPFGNHSIEARISSDENPLHTKALSIDGTFIVVGSQNWDPSAWGDDDTPITFGDLAEYSLGIDSTVATSEFNSKFWDEWDAAHPSLCLGDDTTSSSLQVAIDQAEPGTAIFVPAGNYTGLITVNKPIVLVGAGANETVFQPQGSEPAFRVTSSDVTIANLSISEGTGYGIELIDSSLSSLENIQINRVVFDNNAQGGILAQGLISGSPMDYAIENNTFVGGASGITINILETQTETSIIRNNIFFGQTTAPVHILSANDSNVEYSYNLFDDCGGGACTVNWVQGNLSASSSTHDNLFDLDPLFASPANGAYQLSTGSPAIDAGDPSLFHDFFFDGDGDGFARIDMGAFEYVPIENAAPVVNAGNDQTVELGNSVTVNATYTDADNSEDHSARIDWGDGVVEDVPVTMTGPGAGEVNAQHTYSNTGNYTVEICVTDLYGGVGCDTLNVEVTSPPSDLLFADGFESGNFSAWWWADQNSDLTVSAQAAAVGTYGMQAVVNDTSTLLVYDSSPVDQTHYSARFYFHPNSVNIPNGQGLYLFSASDNTGWIMCLYLQHIGESYLLNLCGKDDARAWFEADGIYINNAWTAVEMEWQAASAPGANNGYLKLWINDTLADSLTNLDTDTLFISTVRLGVDGQPANTTGTMYFDAFESRSGSHIGLDPNGPALYALPAPPDSIFADGFESNDLDAWDWAETNGGNLSTSAQAAAVGNYGMQAVITGGSVMAMTESSVVNVLDESDPFFFNPESESSPNGLEYLLNSFMPEMVVYDNTPRAEKHYNVRFYFDPNSVDLPNGQGMYLFSASDEHWVICLYLERRSGQYRLSLCGEANNQFWLENRYVYITDDWQAIEIEWQAASAPGANNGYMKLYINDVLADEFQNLDNDQRSITGVVLGVDGIPDGTSGTVYFDAFDSHRSTHIGLDPNGPAPSPTNTGWISPAANTAVTSSAGDNNGFQTNPTNAYSDGGGFAVDTNSGTNTNTACSDAGKDRHVFYAYGLPSIPSGSSILGMEVRLDMKVDSTSGSPKSCVELSWNGGMTWTAAKTTTTFTTSEVTYILGGASDTWGHTWTTNELSNLRVRITNVSSKSTSDFSLDWIPVRVSYLPPTPPTNLIFTDGFENGDLSSWNYTETGNGKLSASAASAISGSYGMQAVITDTTTLYVEDWSPQQETHYNVRFYFDPHSVSIPNGGTFYILSNNDLRILLKNNAGIYQVRADIKTDGGTWANGTFVNITNSRQLLEVEWKAATANGANDGFLKFWIDDALVDTRSNVDNDTRVINYIDLGAMWSIPSGTSGTIYFDNFESRRGEHIGP